MKTLLKSALLALALAASGAALADPPPANPQPGDTYTHTQTHCGVGVCTRDTYWYRYSVVGGVGSWDMFFFQSEVIDSTIRLQ